VDIGAELKAKVGPLPLYVWLLIMSVIGGAAYLYFKKKKGSAGQTGTPGTPCTMTDGSAGTWDSTGTVCQATTVSTVNSMTGTGGGRGWRAQSTTATATTTPVTTAAASTPDATAATVPPVAPPVTAPGSGSGSPLAPAVVTGLHVTSTGKNSIGLAWSRSAGATGYQVRVTYQSKVIQTHPVTGTSYTVAGLSPNRTYGLHVVATNGAAWAPEASISQKTSA
jgi:hypothetical protein